VVAILRINQVTDNDSSYPRSVVLLAAPVLINNWIIWQICGGYTGIRVLALESPDNAVACGLGRRVAERAVEVLQAAVDDSHR
jgi:hypothetical protein